MAEGDVLQIVSGHQAFAPGGGSGGVTVLEDPGNVYPAVPTAVVEGYRIKETINSEDRVFEVSVAGTTDGTDASLNDYGPDLTPLGETVTGTETWRYLGVVGRFDFTIVPFQPESLTVDGKGNLSIASGSTADEGIAVLKVDTADESNGSALLEINSDGQGDYQFQDGIVGGPISLDFWTTENTRHIVVSIRSNGIRINGPVVPLLEVDTETGLVWLRNHPTADPGVGFAGVLYTDGAPSAGVPKPLMVSGG